MRFAADPACGHCQSKTFGSWGRASGLRRYSCKAAGCGRTFNALTGTPLAQLHRRDAILVVRDRHGATSDHVLPDLEGATFKRPMRPVVAADAVLVSDGRAAYGQFAGEAGIQHVAIIASAGEHTRGPYHIQNVTADQSRCKSWMAPFKGVASTYTKSYLGWRRMIERDAERSTPRHLIGQGLAVWTATSNLNRAGGEGQARAARGAAACRDQCSCTLNSLQEQRF